MAKTARWRLATVVGAGALALTSGLSAVIISGESAATAGALSAKQVTTAGFTLANGVTPQNITQNTSGADPDFGFDSGFGGSEPGDALTGEASGWVFNIADDWTQGDTIFVTVNPSSGAECQTPNPQGVNASIPDASNYVGFSDFINNDQGVADNLAPLSGTFVVPPTVGSESTAPNPPAFVLGETNQLGTTDTGVNDSEANDGPDGPPVNQLGPCGGDVLGGADRSEGTPLDGTYPNGEPDTYQTLALTLNNPAPTNPSGTTYAVNIGDAIADTLDQFPLTLSGPVLYNTGFGLSTGLIKTTALYCPAADVIFSDNVENDVMFNGDTAVGCMKGDGTTITVAPNANIIGETPAANSPTANLVRNEGTDAVSGPISNFTITENATAALPPEENGIADFSTQNPQDLGSGTTDSFVGASTINGVYASGEVCVVLDEQDGVSAGEVNVTNGNQLAFKAIPGNSWSAANGSSTSSDSATAGPGASIVTTVNSPNDTLELPVQNVSDVNSTIWTAKNLALQGIAQADGPVYAYVYWVDDSPSNFGGGEGGGTGDISSGIRIHAHDTSLPPPETGPGDDCTFASLAQAEGQPGESDGNGDEDQGVATGGEETYGASQGAPLGDSIDSGVDGVETGANSSNYLLGYVQLTTITEQSNSIFGVNADDTAAQALIHQFNPIAPVGGPDADQYNGCVGNNVEAPFLDVPYGPSVFLATDADYHDALGASYPAGLANSGVLLTDPNNLSQVDIQTFKNEGVQTVFVAGGPLAVSNNVVNEIEALPSYLCGGLTLRINPLGGTENINVVREYGQVADDTDNVLATMFGPQPQANNPFFSTTALTGVADPYNGTSGISSNSSPINGEVGLLVTDAGFQDAASASVPAYDDSFPLITTNPTSLSPQALATIYSDHIGTVIVVGGPLAVSDSVLNTLAANGIGAYRIAGTDASDTSVRLAEFELAASGPSGGTIPGLAFNNNDLNWEYFADNTSGVVPANQDLDVNAHAVLLANGGGFQDAEAGGSVLSENNYCANFQPISEVKIAHSNDGTTGDGTNGSTDTGIPEAGPAGVLQPGGFEDESEYYCNDLPMVLTESNTTLGTYVTAFLNQAGLAISGLPGEVPAGGHFSGSYLDVGNFDMDDFPGDQINNQSSSVYTVQPIGGPLALAPAEIAQAVADIG